MKRESAEKELLRIRTEMEANAFVHKWCEDEPAFHEKLNQTIAAKGLAVTDLLKNSDINRNYGYNIINGRRVNPSRDKVLALCIGAKLSLEETQDMLMSAGVGALYYKRERDVRIAVCINNNVGSVTEVNILLESHDLPPLEV